MTLQQMIEKLILELFEDYDVVITKGLQTDIKGVAEDIIVRSERLK